MKKFTADFETCTWLEDETYVWAWALCDIDNPDNIQIGTDIDSFFKLCCKYKNSKIYFHNLKFDGSFLISYLIEQGYTLIKDRSEATEKSFYPVISDLGAFYTITVYIKKYKTKVEKITFIDSLKIINFSVKDIAKTFNLPISKLEIDYNQFRPRDYQLTEEEKSYITNDVKIVALALRQLFNEHLTKSTAAANALGYYKQITGKERFEHFFPQLSYEVDSLIRPAYRGGFTYLNPIYKDKVQKNVYVLDVNSLYPSCMLKPMPIGTPVFFDGKYKENKLYPLYIQTIMCSFKIKKNKIPTIQIKDKNLFFAPNEYVEDSDGEEFILTLTNIDLEMFLDHYEITSEIDYLGGYMFRATEGLFDNYINYWTEQKIKAGKEGNKGKRTIAKLQLNSLYRKFAKSTRTRSKYPVMGKDGLIHYELGDPKKEDGIYIPVAAFITSYRRQRTIGTSQAIKDYSIEKYGKDMYIYSDTDSIHTTLPIEECKKFCEIDDFKLGYWAHEATAEKGLFIRQKCYLEQIDGKMKITCAGLPERCYDQVTWDNFKEGFTAHGKLTYKQVKGGVKLVETDFTIKVGGQGDFQSSADFHQKNI